MKPRNVIPAAVVLALVAGSLSFYFFRHTAKEVKRPDNVPTKPVVAAAANIPNNPPTNSQKTRSIKTRFPDLTSKEQSAFAADFEKRYKPALQKWCNAFNGHVPFSPDEVTPKNFIERIGRDASYHEYVFVVDGITLGIEDKNGSAQVDYLNNPHQTQKLTAQPNGTQAPIATTPVTREELIKMLAAAGGKQFPANEIRIIPSGFSGNLNGGMLVHVGGNPENAASWKYDMIFGADGKLAYYLVGI